MVETGYTGLSFPYQVCLVGFQAFKHIFNNYGIVSIMNTVCRHDLANTVLLSIKRRIYKERWGEETMNITNWEWYQRGGSISA
jgi:hypothetical protein